MQRKIMSLWKNIVKNVIIISLPFFIGCSQQQQLADLYIDAVMLSEVGKNEMAKY
jgi:hypothetical protein